MVKTPAILFTAYERDRLAEARRNLTDAKESIKHIAADKNTGYYSRTHARRAEPDVIALMEAADTLGKMYIDLDNMIILLKKLTKETVS